VTARGVCRHLFLQESARSQARHPVVSHAEVLRVRCFVFGVSALDWEAGKGSEAAKWLCYAEDTAHSFGRQRGPSGRCSLPLRETTGPKGVRVYSIRIPSDRSKMGHSAHHGPVRRAGGPRAITPIRGSRIGANSSGVPPKQRSGQPCFLLDDDGTLGRTSRRLVVPVPPVWAAVPDTQGIACCAYSASALPV
jgi:hypothetical protein